MTLSRHSSNPRKAGKNQPRLMGLPPCWKSLAVRLQALLQSAPTLAAAPVHHARRPGAPPALPAKRFPMSRHFFASILLLASTTLFSAPPPTGIVGTAHDLSSTGLNKVTVATNVCIFCHATHTSASSAQQLIPSWNRTTTSTTFQMYNSSVSQTLKGSVDNQPTGPSLSCLSCHDGTVAMGSVLNAPVGGGQNVYTSIAGGVSNASGRMTGANVVGPNLTGDHPVSITYQDNLNSGLKVATTLTGVKLYPSNTTGSKVHCSSCHDVHNYGTVGANAPFLRVTLANSALCVSCHKM